MNETSQRERLFKWCSNVEVYGLRYADYNCFGEVSLFRIVEGFKVEKRGEG
jgi:hypothetical protein